MADSFRRIDRATAIDRSLRYPYAVAEDCYHFIRGESRPIKEAQQLIEGRIPVIGYGSNSAAEALDRKYRDHNDMYTSGIPVMVGQLQDFSIVYAAQFSPYGALPATIHPVTGAGVRTAITFLTEAQLLRMHDTEDVDLYYSFEEIDGSIALNNGLHIERPLAYVALGGSICTDEGYLALEAIQQQSPQNPKISQRDVQQRVIDLLGLEHSVEDFISENALQEDTRNARFLRLSSLVGDVWHR
ncbi:Uncharacterised protein [BD1-7 clade bacterium]|uniref:Uncharacterized protein n=1 Tax=BD1-7 clade bacterium TaxID=2029982 RepID=A0A5S9N0D1_9GAMM|nr:Uncharacterised protein [BD1-7 clade bacterium]